MNQLVHLLNCFTFAGTTQAKCGSSSGSGARPPAGARVDINHLSHHVAAVRSNSTLHKTCEQQRKASGGLTCPSCSMTPSSAECIKRPCWRRQPR